MPELDGEHVEFVDGVRTYRTSWSTQAKRMIEHPPATDHQVLEAALAGCAVAFESTASLYPYLAFDHEGQYISRYVTEREAWNAAWLVVQHHMKFPGEKHTFIEGVD